MRSDGWSSAVTIVTSNFKCMFPWVAIYLIDAFWFWHRVKYGLDQWTFGLFFGLFFGPFFGLFSKPAFYQKLCLIRHKSSYKLQFSLFRPLSFQYTSINRQRLINFSPFRQSNKKLLASFAITSGTKRNSVTVNNTVRIMKTPWLVNFRFCCMWSRNDGSRFVIPLSERKMLGFYWKDQIKRELSFIGWWWWILHGQFSS